MKGETKTAEKGVAKGAEKSKEDQLLEILDGISAGIETVSNEVKAIDRRVRDIETKGANKFMEGALPEDIAEASQTRGAVDPKISKIVDEMLGTDFQVRLEPLGDRPGLRFTLIVPPRLSDNVTDKRPVKEIGENGQPTGAYKKDAAGNTIFEDYMPEDRRSCILSTSESYDAVRKHCERVRGYIVSFFQKTNQPLPEFNLK